MTVIIGYLGCGANLGDRKMNLAQAVNALNDRPDLAILRTSGIYETAPWGLTDQPDFLNMVVEFETSIPPAELLERVKKLEQSMGREEGPRFGSRLLAIDILLMGDLVVEEPYLIIPHASLHERAFVLVPLAELAPDAVHPVLGRSIADLARQVGGLDGVKPLV